MYKNVYCVQIKNTFFSVTQHVGNMTPAESRREEQSNRWEWWHNFLMVAPAVAVVVIILAAAYWWRKKHQGQRLFLLYNLNI